MKLTNNQEDIKEYVEKRGLTIFTNVEEKNGIFSSANGGDFYECDSCGQERHLSEPYPEEFICGECFNSSNKLPFMAQDINIYLKEKAELPKKVMELFKANKDLSEVVKLLKDIKGYE